MFSTPQRIFMWCNYSSPLGRVNLTNQKVISVVLINYFIHLWRWKGSNNRRSVKILIINLLFMFICQTQKKERKLREFERKKIRGKEKKCLLSDRSPSSGQINDFFSSLEEELLLLLLLLRVLLFMLTRRSIILRLSLFVFCLLFSDIRPFIEALLIAQKPQKEVRSTVGSLNSRF